MIIAIGGRMGSGKNTVCDIIQDLCNKHNGPNFEQKAFAGKLKQTASLLTGIPVEKFEDQDFKLTNLPEEWSSLRQSGRSKAWIPMTYREFLQRLGTEAMRDGLHTNVWVNALFSDYVPIVKEWDEFGNDALVEYPSWCITDMRFSNEMEAVKERKGITIRVVRYKVNDKVYWTDPENISSGTYEIFEVYQDFCCIYNDFSEAEVPYHEIKHKSESLHASEIALDDATFDYEIVNDGTIEELVEKVREILINEKLL